MADMIRLQRSGGYTVLPNGILRDTTIITQNQGAVCHHPLTAGGVGLQCGRAGYGGRLWPGCHPGALKEIEVAGYLTRMRAHGEGGKFTGRRLHHPGCGGTIVGKPDNG